MRTHEPETDVEYVEANGLRFATLQEGEGPLVLLMHGFPDTAHTWDHVRPALAEAGYRAVSPFMRGYAPTEIPEGDAYTGQDLGTDVIALIEALGYERAVIVGHDWGASACYAAAGLDPDRIEKLVTIAIPHPRTIKPGLGDIWKFRHFIAFKLPGALGRFKRKDFQTVNDLYKRWSSAWDAPADEFEAAKNAFAAPGCANAALGYYRCLSTKLDSFMKNKLKMPTLCFAGETDVIAPEVYEKARWMFEGDYQIERLPGGHFMHRESPDEFVAKLLAYLGPGATTDS